MTRFLFSLMRLGLIFVLSQSVLGEEYPNKTIKIIAGASPGSATDFVTRIISERLSKKLRQVVVVENRTGAQSLLPALAILNDKPDGYTLLVAPAGVFSVTALRKQPPFDPLQDFTLISNLGSFYPPLLVISSKNNITRTNKTPKENFSKLLTNVRVDFKNGFYATGSIIGFLVSEQFNTLGRIGGTRVNYKSESAALIGLLTEEVQWMFALPVNVVGHVQNGTMIPIATTGRDRNPLVPHVPSLIELGYDEFKDWQEVVSVVALVGPGRGDSKIPNQIVDRLHREVSTILSMPDVQKLFRQRGFEPKGSTPKELSQIIIRSTEVWSSIMKKSGIEKD